MIPNAPLFTFPGTLPRSPELRDAVTRETVRETQGAAAPGKPGMRRLYAVFTIVRLDRQRTTGTAPTIRCILFDAHRPEHEALRKARPGDAVEVTGHWKLFQYRDRHGELVTLRQLVVHRVRVAGR
jgi:hypothetical protein